MKYLALLLSLASITSYAKDDVNKIIYAENRIGYGVKLSEQEYIKKIGLNKWISSQLKGNIQEPKFLTDKLAELSINKYSTTDIINSTKSDKDDTEEKKKINRNKLELYSYEVFQQNTLRALYSPNQLKERMSWFWFNHFNVYVHKGAVKSFLPDYYENVIHKNSLGNFKDLLRDTLKHPAMSFYLDNFQNTSPESFVAQHNKNAKIGVNENYARELLELHTLGQGKGYKQEDVQELAKILTGFTFRKDLDGPIIKNKEMADKLITEEYFVFDPRMHDYNEKKFMGHLIKGGGYSEIEEVLDILISNPNTANNISKKLAIYFVDDSPSDKLIANMSKQFIKTKGDIPSVLSVLFKSKEFWAKQQKLNKFKLPHEYAYSIVRITYDDLPITNITPIWNNIKNLGEIPFGKLTPDGYGLKNKDWISPDQMEKRFVFSNLLNNKKTNLFHDDEISLRHLNIINGTDNKNRKQNQDNPTAFKMIYESYKTYLSENTKKVLTEAPQNEQIGYLLASPEFINK